MLIKRHRFKKISVSCPFCGHAQEEPSQVISSFCRNCGEYFRVRKGVTISYSGPLVSGISDYTSERKSNQKKDKTSNKGKNSPEEPSPKATEAFSSHSSDSTSRDEVPLPASVFFGFTDQVEGAEMQPPVLGVESQGREALAQGSMAALIGASQTVLVAEKDHMPPDYLSEEQDRSAAEIATRPVRCFRCSHVQNVSTFAKSTQCGRCNTYINLANYQIRTTQSHTLRTRGDITVTRRGGLVGNCEIACHNLFASGPVDATVDCSGEAVFRHSGIVRSEVYCDSLVVEKGCEVRFPIGVMANRVEILGHVSGDVTCSGTVYIGSCGLVEGNLNAVALDLKEGGQITGETRLDSSITTTPPARNGFHPEIIG